MKRIERYLITGLVTFVPVVLTIYILVISFRFVDGILGRYLNVYFKQAFGFYVPGLGFLFLFLLILSAGFLVTQFIGKNFLRSLEKWFSGLPLIDKIYPTVKQIILFITAQKEFGFKKVVLVEYPSKGIWSLGFVTSEEFRKVNEMLHADCVCVFVPNSPGPLTGYVIFVPRQSVLFLDMPVIDALKIIISDGVVMPGAGRNPGEAGKP